MPDDHTENINRLYWIKRVELLIEESGSYEKSFSPECEHIIWGSETYLEDNAFSTGHQSVNVHGLPEKRYEVRSEDSAVDVQIHRQTGRTAESVKTAISAQDAQINTASSVERVYSTQYGEGEIISRTVSGGKTWITVQYANVKKGYDENLALTMKAIIKR